VEGECAMNVFEMIGEGGKCTTACLRSLSRVEGFRLRMGRGVGAGEGFVGVENMVSEYEGGRGRMRVG
jgi:hypothetical protein